MTKANFYVVYIKRLSDVSLEDVEKRMNLATDWYRIRADLWIVYSSGDQEKWYKRLSPLVKETGTLFICRLDEDARQGWMDANFWEWFRHRPPASQASP